MPNKQDKAPKRNPDKPKDDDNSVLNVLKRGFVELAESGALGSRRRIVEEEKKKSGNKNNRGM